jgi:hypothetical protein
MSAKVFFSKKVALGKLLLGAFDINEFRIA